MGIINNLLKNLGFKEDEELRTYEAVQCLPVKKQEDPSLQEKNLVTIRPKTFSDIEKVVDVLREGECSIIDMGEIKIKDTIRIIDFLSGAVYALKAELKRLQGDLYLLIPCNIKLNIME